MIDHITFYVSDLKKSKEFYEKAFEPLGFKLSFGEEDIFWAFDVGKGCLFEIAQYRGETPLTHTHIALRVESHEKVQRFYKAAITAGASCNGKPGPRPNYTEKYYACFIHDFDQHNIEVMFDEYPDIR